MLRCCLTVLTIERVLLLVIGVALVSIERLPARHQPARVALEPVVVLIAPPPEAARRPRGVRLPAVAVALDAAATASCHKFVLNRSGRVTCLSKKQWGFQLSQTATRS